MLLHQLIPEKTRTFFSNRLAMCTTCGTTEQVVPCPHAATKGCNPITDGWRSDKCCQSFCQTLHGVDSSLALLGHASPQQHLGVASLHHRGNMHTNLHTTNTLGAIRSSFAPLNQVLHTWVSCTYRFHCSYVDCKSTAAQRGNLYIHSQLSAHKKPPNLGNCLQF